jgi:hypothetical protein
MLAIWEAQETMELKEIIIHLRRRPAEGWLAGPDTAPDGAIGPKPNFSQPVPIGCLTPCSCDLFASLPLENVLMGQV